MDADPKKWWFSYLPWPFVRGDSKCYACWLISESKAVFWDALNEIKSSKPMLLVCYWDEMSKC